MKIRNFLIVTLFVLLASCTSCDPNETLLSDFIVGEWVTMTPEDDFNPWIYQFFEDETYKVIIGPDAFMAGESTYTVDNDNDVLTMEDVDSDLISTDATWNVDWDKDIDDTMIFENGIVTVIFTRQ